MKWYYWIATTLASLYFKIAHQHRVYGLEKPTERACHNRPKSSFFMIPL